MQDYNLKPCPFCGRSPDVYQAPKTMILMGMPYSEGEWICLCLHCQQSAVGGKKYSDVVKKWNRRTPEWFSVSKTLPADNRACLIATAEGLAVAGYCGNGEWVLDYDKLSIKCEVTHWRELPDKWEDAAKRLPPEDEDKKAYLVKVGSNVTIAEYYGDGEWMTYSLCNITRLVTHWQKIPMNKPWEGEEEDV